MRKGCPAPNFTQVPNDLFDHWLPLLGEVEVKVLLIVFRKTFGWHKVRDRISLSQMERLTGSCRKNIIKAVDSLQEKGLIIKDTVGKNGSQETYYELVIEDSNSSDQCPDTTPPSGATPPPPVAPRHPQKKQSPTETEKERKEGSLPSFSSDLKEKEDLLKPLGLQSDAGLMRIPTETLRTAIECAKEKPRHDMASFIQKAAQEGWKAPEKAQDVVVENKLWASSYSLIMYRFLPPGVFFEVLNKGVEIGYSAAQVPPDMIPYEERAFKEMVLSSLRKKGVITKENA